MNKRSLILLFALGVFAAFAVESCKHSPYHPLMPIDTTGNGNGGPGDTTHKTLPPKHPCSPDSVYFVNDILPLVTSNCSMSGCHDGSGHSDDARALTSYSTIMSYVNTSNPTSSKLYTVLFSKDDNKMPPPPATQLTKTQDSILLVWIKQGALNNKCDGPCDTTNVTFSNTISPIMQTSCVGCHSGSKPGGNISLTNYQEILAQANNGKLLGSVTYTTGFVGMPVTTKLSDCDVNAIRIWISKGAQNN